MKKELRALLPLWAAGVAGLAVVCLAFPPWTTAARLFYGLASVSLAAFSVGHEYVYETLPLFLTLPAPRRRLLTMKLVALVPMLLTLGALALVMLPPDPDFDRHTIAPRLSLLCAILVAPLLTMLTRSPLSGTVLAVGVAGGMQLFSGNVAQWGLLAASVVGAIGGWRTFMGLEIAGDHSANVNLLHWLHAPMTPMWLLVEKELRLQQIAFILTAYYVAGWAIVSLAWPQVQPVPAVVAALGLIYGALLAILVGSLASAEERQMHTHEWQLLLPVPAWKQWTVKTVVALGLALLLGFALPTFLAAGEVSVSAWMAAVVVCLTVGSIYISSVSPGGFRALAVAAPVMLILLMAFFSWVGPVILSAAFNWPTSWPLVLGTAVLITLALRFGYTNHMRAGRDLTRVGWQLIWMATVIAIVGAAYWPAQIRY